VRAVGLVRRSVRVGECFKMAKKAETDIDPCCGRPVSIRRDGQ
jgi:hypothetical protein